MVWRVKPSGKSLVPSPFLPQDGLWWCQLGSTRLFPPPVWRCMQIFSSAAVRFVSLGRDQTDGKTLQLSTSSIFPALNQQLLSSPAFIHSQSKLSPVWTVHWYGLVVVSSLQKKSMTPHSRRLLFFTIFNISFSVYFPGFIASPFALRPSHNSQTCPVGIPVMVSIPVAATTAASIIISVALPV